MAHYLFRRILILLVINAIRTAEIRYPALSGNACAPEKYDPAALIDHLLELFDLFLIHLSVIPPVRSVCFQVPFLYMLIHDLQHLLPHDL